MTSVIVLDSGPLGLLVQRLGLPLADQCRAWLAHHLNSGVQILVPEIADFEVRRELLRLDKQTLTAGLPAQGLIIATTNPVHLARFIAAEFWQNI